MDSAPLQVSRDQFGTLGYSLRRYLVDDFHFRHVVTLPEGGLVLDLGGNRIRKRGFFDIDQFGLQVFYANLSTAKQPHVQADAGAIPFDSEVFDAVICAELLEHVPHPPAVLAEAHRVLRKGGVLLLCVPLLNRIHGDPHDYGRYTDSYWSHALQTAGFRDTRIEKQGRFWCVLVDMVRDLVVRKTASGVLAKPSAIRLLATVMAMCKRKALEWDAVADDQGGRTPVGYTTGFGITARKA
ncbi:MAG: methyltransferase domain-containing protein [Desulfomonile tiedjei]|nr:methyltransferase domain-containing protein [Desulfomonile tiedjei]